MAEAAQIETVKITVNDIELQVPRGEIIVESVKRLGLDIPVFCYHSRLKPVGMCRMCFVEVGFRQQDGSVKKMPKPQAACTLPASDNLAIFTDTEMVHRDRKGVLEFLLINHPLDCPICDRGGECPLQNNTLFYGPSTTRFLESKRHLPKAFPLSEYVTLDLERCIQCGRCVRFTEEISGDSELAFRFRGALMQPSTFELRDFTSKFSGNVIEICPVGALTSSKYRFRARPWDLETRPGICTVCSNGCNVWMDYRVGKIVRVNGRTNEAVNEEWTCDRGKFGHDFYNAKDRLTTPLIRKGNSLVPCDWAEAYTAIIDAFGIGGNEVAALVNATCSNEDLYALKVLFESGFRSNNIDYRFRRTLRTEVQRLPSIFGFEEVQTSLAAMETRKRILVFGSSLAEEAPILFLRVRKAWFQNGAKVVVATDSPTEADTFADTILRFKPGTEAEVASCLLKLLVESGKAQVPPGTRKLLDAISLAGVCKSSGVTEENLRAAAETAAGATIVATRELLHLQNAQDVIETLAGIAMTTGGEFNLYSTIANEEGADLLQMSPSSNASTDDASPAVGLGTHGILAGCEDGSVQALWLVDADPLSLWHDSKLVKQALETVPFLVYQGPLNTDAAAFASIVLPMCAPAEANGSYTNLERRVQRMERILEPPSEAKPAWRIFSEVGLRIRPQTPKFNASEVFDEIARNVAAFNGLSFENLPPEGALLQLNQRVAVSV